MGLRCLVFNILYHQGRSFHDGLFFLIGNEGFHSHMWIFLLFLFLSLCMCVCLYVCVCVCRTEVSKGNHGFNGMLVSLLIGVFSSAGDWYWWLLLPSCLGSATWYVTCSTHHIELITWIRKLGIFHLLTVYCRRQCQLDLDLDMHACKNLNIMK